MNDRRRKAVPCVLCNDPELTYDTDAICGDCRGSWKVGVEVKKMRKTEEKIVKALVEWYPHMSAHHGDVEGNTDLHWTDIAAAMGAVSLSDSGLDWFGGRPREIGDSANPSFGSKSQELVQVPEARALAMEKILRAFHNGVAKAKADGIDEGRNLLLGLARGEVKLSDYDETTAAAAMQRKRRSRR